MFTVKYSRKLACLWVKALFSFLGLVCKESRFRARFGGRGDSNRCSRQLLLKSNSERMQKNIGIVEKEF